MKPETRAKRRYQRTLSREQVLDLVRYRFDREADGLRPYIGGTLSLADWKRLRSQLLTAIVEIDALLEGVQ